MHRLNRQIWVALALLLAGLITYAWSFGNSFVLDDESQIVANEFVHDPSHVFRFFLGSTMNQASDSGNGGVYYKPFMVIVYSVLWWLTPGESWSFHLLQLLIAVANGFLVYRLFRNWVSEIAALLAGFVYLLHPINCEVVTYIADLQDVMYTGFGLWALNALLDIKKWTWGAVFALTGLLLASLFSKESGLLYLVTALVVAYGFRPQAFKATLFAVLMTLLIYWYLRVGLSHLSSVTYAVNHIGRASLTVRLLTAPLLFTLYFFKFIYPAVLTTTQDWVIEDPTLLNFGLPLLLQLALLGASLWFARRLWSERKNGRVFAFFAFWVFMGMGFHSHILVPLDGTLADRWFYFPEIGVLGLLAVLLDRRCGWTAGSWRTLWQWPRTLSVASVVVVLGLSGRSFARSLNWQDNYTICSHDVLDIPYAYDLHNNIGVELFRQGKVLEARSEFEKSTELAPLWDINWSNLGATYSRTGDLHKAEENYLISMSRGSYYMAYQNYAEVLVAEGRLQEAEKFIVEKALPKFPASEPLNRLHAALVRQSQGH